MTHYMNICLLLNICNTDFWRIVLRMHLHMTLMCPDLGFWSVYWNRMRKSFVSDCEAFNKLENDKEYVHNLSSLTKHSNSMIVTRRRPGKEPFANIFIGPTCSWRRIQWWCRCWRGTYINKIDNNPPIVKWQQQIPHDLKSSVWSTDKSLLSFYLHHHWIQLHRQSRHNANNNSKQPQVMATMRI